MLLAREAVGRLAYYCQPTNTSETLVRGSGEQQGTPRAPASRHTAQRAHASRRLVMRVQSCVTQDISRINSRIGYMCRLAHELVSEPGCTWHHAYTRVTCPSLASLTPPPPRSQRLVPQLLQHVWLGANQSYSARTRHVIGAKFLGHARQHKAHVKHHSKLRQYSKFGGESTHDVVRFLSKHR